MDTSYVYEYVHVYADLDMYMKGLNQGQVVRAFVGCVGCVDVGFGVGVFVTMGNLLPEDFPSEADSPSKGSRVQSRARGKGICWVCVVCGCGCVGGG